MSTPSFSSFPPVFDSFPDLEAGSSSRPRSAHEAKSTRDEHDKQKNKKDKSEKAKREEEGKERRRVRDKRENKEKRHEHRDDKVSRDERDHSSKHRDKRGASYGDYQEYGSSAHVASESFNRYYYIDRKGDELNIRYGSLHAGDVPKYWHIARGKQVLGLQPNLSVVHRGSKGVEIGEAGWLGRTPQLSDTRARAFLHSGHTRRLSATPKSVLKYEEVDGFIRTASRKGKEKDQEYRSITFGDKIDSGSDSSSQSEDELSDDDSDTSPLSAREEALRSLEQRLAKDPTSESDWLSLLHHSVSGIDPSSKHANRTRAEISISILERALSAHPSNACSFLLRMKYLKAGEEMWDMAKTRDEWNKALETIAMTDMYVEWLDWVVRSTPDFNSVVELAAKATNLVANSAADDNADFAKLRIFWRVVTLFRHAGYVERGFALFQAQAELSFNIPNEDKHSPFEKQLDSLEEFWESEVPRVGEAGAKGWETWKVNRQADSGTKRRQIVKCKSSDPFAIWHFEETQSDACLIFPARMPSAEGGEHLEEQQEDEDLYEDPYAAVLFSDIRPFLVDLRTERGRQMLRLIWLSYLGLHIPDLSSALSSSAVASDDRWADTYFMQPSFVESLFPRSSRAGFVTSDSQTGVIIGREKTYAKSFNAVKSWSLDVLEPLEGLTIDGEYRMWSKGCLDGFDSEIIDAMRRIFKELRHDSDRRQWDVAELAFEASLPHSERALKRSQTLLSENSSSAELLASHAHLERIRRKYEKARKVYRVGLQSLEQSSDSSVVCLWWGSAELEWLLSKSEGALEVVLRAAGQPNDRSGINILRAKRRLEELCQQSAAPEWRFRLKWIKLRILLELLVGTLDTAIEVSQRFLACEESGGLQHESLTVTSLVMIYHHTVTLRNPAPPAVLRNLVRDSLNTYPSNSIIIGLFLECEKGESVWGRVRSLMSENMTGTLREKSVVRRLIDVWMARWEEDRWVGEVERVRQGLEAAVTSDRTKGSPILWKVFVKFEIAAGNVKRAKAVLFRALKECPLVKELYLLAFEENLRHAYTRRELMDLADTIAERGIRLRRSLGDMMEIHGQEDAPDSDKSVDEDEDELEYESREMKRLMPY